MLGLFIALIVTIFVVKLILKKYKPHTVLMLAGIVLMLFAIVFNLGTILPPSKSTGFKIFDIFEFIKVTFSKNNAGLGLIIISVAGFVKYMDYIGASNALVKVIIKPLQRINAPYIVLSISYILGQTLNVFIPSASGLGVLLMATLYPILVRLGVSKLSATAVIATTACLDLGPASGNSNLVAKTAEIESAVYFVKHQIPVAISVIIVITILHYIVQKRFDKKIGHIVEENSQEESNKKELDNIPNAYAILPIVPLMLILVFSEFIISTIKMDVITAMFIGIFISMSFEMVRYRDIKKVFASIQIFYDEMGVSLARVITLIVSGQIFAEGLKVVGSVNKLIELTQSAGFSSAMIVVIMTFIISVLAVIMGSGNAPFFSFAALVPDLASKMGITSVYMLLPMQFASGIARTFSPITPVVVAVSGISDVSTMDVIKRTAIPMIGALVTTVVANYILFN